MQMDNQVAEKSKRRTFTVSKLKKDEMNEKTDTRVHTTSFKVAETVSSTFRDSQFDGSLQPIYTG